MSQAGTNVVESPLDSVALQREFVETLPELARSARAASAPHPRLLVLNDAVAEDLGLSAHDLRTPRGLRFLTGEQPPPGAEPVAQVYAGHQWGVFKPLLGDGRALLLGERRAHGGRLVDLHLKGVGPTSMSRLDGYAAIAPMLREYLMGEAMQALGVPTTRALAVVATGATHRRDDTDLPGAVLARVARSHLRIGTFEYARATGDHDLLRRLADHAIARLFPESASADHPYRALFSAVVDAHARLTAHWVRLGFVHGVLSTDNVTISGETIDYGPCAFIDRYDPGIWFSSIDEHGRYAYDRQAPIMAWNLARLGDALAPLLGRDPSEAQAFIDAAVQHYTEEFERLRAEAFRDKLGLTDAPADGRIAALADRALALLAAERVDFTGFFRALAPAAHGDDTAVHELFPDPGTIDPWLRDWRAHGPSGALIRSVNPAYIPRNHLLDAALTHAAAGDLAPFRTLLDLVSHPFSERANADPVYLRPAPAELQAHRTFCGT